MLTLLRIINRYRDAERKWFSNTKTGYADQPYIAILATEGGKLNCEESILNE